MKDYLRLFVLDGLRGKESVADLSYCDGTSLGIYTNGPMVPLKLRNSCAHAYFLGIV